MVQLLLNSYLSYQRLFDLVTRKTCFLDLLDRNLYASSLVPSKLYFTITSFSEVCFSGLHEFKICFGNVAEQLFKLYLFYAKLGLVVSFLDEGSTGLDPLNIT